MKKLILLTALLCCARTVGIAQESGVEQLMYKRVINQRDAGYNTVLLIPRLYRENKTDTLNAVIAYVQNNFGSIADIEPFIILNQVRNRTFREEVRNVTLDTGIAVKRRIYTDSEYYRNNIFGYYLLWYKDNFHIRDENGVPLYIRKAYGEYFDFISSLSKEELKTPGLKPVEQLLLAYFMQPSDSILLLLKNDEYNGTSLQTAWIKYHKERISISGTNWSVFSGMWIPLSKLAVLGNHPYIGYAAGSKYKSGWMIDFSMDFKFLKSPNYYLVPVDSIKFRTNHFFGFNFCINAGYQLLKYKRHELDIIGGIGYDIIGTISESDATSNSFAGSDGELMSLNLNAGLGYKFYIAHRTKRDSESFHYLSLQTRYNFQFFNNGSGTDLSGGAISIGLVYGAYSRKVPHFYVED